MRPKAPIYTLPHGIEVIAEYPLRGQNRYVRVRIRVHPFFPDAKPNGPTCCVRRSRVVMSSKLGRSLGIKECVHHIDENRSNDHPDNLEIIDPVEHNRHHKTGTKHSDESKAKTSVSMKRAWRSGLHAGRPITKRDKKGRISK